jgi:hypothetical protein
VIGARDRAEIFKGADGWYFRILAANNKELVVSEAHANKTDVWRVVENHYPGIPIAEIEPAE